MVRKLKMQVTFEGDGADNKAIGWLNNLAQCFNIRRAKLTEIKQTGNREKVRLEVRFD